MRTGFLGRKQMYSFEGGSTCICQSPCLMSLAFPQMEKSMERGCGGVQIFSSHGVFHEEESQSLPRSYTV